MYSERDDLIDGRIPWSWGNIPAIFMASLKELLRGPGSVLRVTAPLVFPVLSVSKGRFDPGLQPFAGMALWYYGISLFLFVFFRYYFLPSHWPVGMQLTANLLYGGLFALLIAVFYDISGILLALSFFSSGAVAFFLMFDP